MKIHLMFVYITSAVFIIIIIIIYNSDLSSQFPNCLYKYLELSTTFTVEKNIW